MAEALRTDASLASSGAVWSEKAEPVAAAKILLSVENMRCGGCMSAIERALMATGGVLSARANLSLKRVEVTFMSEIATSEDLTEALSKAGFRAAVLSDNSTAANEDILRDLLRRLAVAGFGAANVMLLSVSVWAGLASDMDPAQQTLFHWLSALIALPVIAFAAQPFFRSASEAIKAFRLNMDVPISLGILLATGMSFVQTMKGTEQVYFDAAVMLTFFLLIGRFLDERMRVTARGAAQNLLAFKALNATLITRDGATLRVDANDVQPGSRVLVAKGERVPVDGRIETGLSDLDEAIITGEPQPRQIRFGDHVHAGAINLTAPVELIATTTADSTLLSEIASLMAAAEQGRGRYRRLADRAAAIYAPAVHILGAGTLVGWLAVGASWDQSLTYAIAVLIITCPCALALAVPAVQVAASSRLFSSGIIVKAADGLERIAETDAIVFDKTGTLTSGNMKLVNGDNIPDAVLQKAASLAIASRHPYARAVVSAASQRGLQIGPADGVREIPGCGLEAFLKDGRISKLGSADFVDAAPTHGEATVSSDALLWFRDDRLGLIKLQFSDELRPDALDTVQRLEAMGYDISLLSGDRIPPVSAVSTSLGIERWRAGLKPDEKLREIETMTAHGQCVLMVGDGLNDAPALAAGHGSLSPTSAADIAQTAADGVFQGEKLMPVVETILVAKAARRIALQNFAIALAYNAVCVPLAVAGHVTPLIAALAMSGSSIAVTANSLRLYTKRLRLA